MTKIFIGIAIGLLSILTSLPSFAHQLNRANDVGVTIHIAPDDTPRVGQESTIFVEVSSNNGSFPVEQCDCWLFIGSTESSNYDSGRAFTLKNQFNPVPYTFEEPGKYNLLVSGIPHEYIENAEFNEFETEFEIEVLPPANTWPKFLLMAGIFLASTVAAVWTAIHIRKTLIHPAEQ